MSNTFFNLLIVHDPSKSMKKITPFLGINVTEREINQIAWKPSFREMKTDAAKDNCGPNKTICVLRGTGAWHSGKVSQKRVRCLAWGSYLEVVLFYFLTLVSPKCTPSCTTEDKSSSISECS